METLTMSRKERRRLELCGGIERGELTVVKAAELAGLSYRQMKRVCARYRQESDGGLVHRLRGRPSNRHSDLAMRDQVLSLYRERYYDFGPKLATEYLAREHQLAVGVETLRRWLIREGLWQVKRKRSLHRRWRERKACRGEMLQMDGSHHDWFEGRRDWACLMVMVDDATSFTHARFFEGETTAASMLTFWRYVEENGMPCSLYVDRSGIYEPTRWAKMDEDLAERGPLTQFGRAMQELGVEVILARSPQAKGRVERMNGLLQDRLVKAMRLLNINDLETANRYLEENFLAELNRHFNVEPKQPADVHRAVPEGVQLAHVLSFQDIRLVQNDWTVSWRGRRFQLTAANQKLVMARQRVLVCEQLDGRISLVYRDRELEWEEVDRKKKPKGPPGTPTGLGRIRRPAANHPWRRNLFPERAAARPPCSTSVAALPSLRKAGGEQETNNTNVPLLTP
jgi:hypothetical protein